MCLPLFRKKYIIAFNPFPGQAFLNHLSYSFTLQSYSPMKKLSTLFVFCFLTLLFLASSLSAQIAPEDHFVGTWKVKAYALPQGDTEMIIQFERKEGKLSGGIADATTKQVIPFTKVETAAGKLTAYFIAPEQQMEVYLTLEKKDDTTVTGSIMNMFAMDGTKSK
jgi:hypothetical protein